MGILIRIFSSQNDIVRTKPFGIPAGGFLLNAAF